MGISLWLVPSEPESALLQRLMARHPEPEDAQQQQQQQQYRSRSFPHFHPHVTLATIRATTPSPGDAAPGAAAVDADAAELLLATLALREAVPIGQKAIRLRFARVLAGDHYFRSIYVSIAPSAELAQLRAEVVQALLLLLAAQQAQAEEGRVGVGAGVGAPLPAFPHLSLYYVADEEAHVRERFLQELERERIVRHSEDGLSVGLFCAGGGEDGNGDDSGRGRVLLEGFTGTQLWIVDCAGPVEGWKVLDKILLAKVLS
ncbi:2',3'-cyclic-nucleotide 3'-phosphodiesterase [Russula compacta]|nr:2',3'-cyclic-nucleotide 3'-phosphodiesterase [Russula compacta]